MPISQIIMARGTSGGGVPSISIYGWSNPMNEGSSNTATVEYQNYPPTTIYWQIVNDTTGNADWNTGEPGGMPLGNFYIEGSGTTTFSWSTAADLTTEGDEYYLLQVSTFLGGHNLLNQTLTISDTSMSTPAPTISGIFPSSGGEGIGVNISGTNLNGVTSVTFGGAPATISSFVLPTLMRVFTPSGSGTVDVTYTTPGGSVTVVNGFTFV